MNCAYCGDDSCETEDLCDLREVAREVVRIWALHGAENEEMSKVIKSLARQVPPRFDHTAPHGFGCSGCMGGVPMSDWNDFHGKGGISKDRMREIYKGYSGDSVGD